MNNDTDQFGKVPDECTTKGYGILQGGTRVAVAVYSTIFNQGLQGVLQGLR